MSSESGGAMSANTREGFRSESLARFALSAFGPATDVEVEDDHGVDLVCATARRVGRRLQVGPSYLVQVKSAGEQAPSYRGPHAREWLECLGSPLFLCTVDKIAARVRLYSTWSLSRVLLHLRHHDGSADLFQFMLDADVTAEQPPPTAIPVGAPIIDFSITELHDAALTERLRTCLEQWVGMDTENIIRRRSGIPISKGYTKWRTNEPPTSGAEWYKPHFYSESAAKEARRTLVDCATVIALHGIPEEKAALGDYVRKHCELGTVEQWARSVLGV